MSVIQNNINSHREGPAAAILPYKKQITVEEQDTDKLGKLSSERKACHLIRQTNMRCIYMLPKLKQLE